MSPRTTLTVTALLLALSCPLILSVAPADDAGEAAVEPKVKSIINDMADYLANRQSSSVRLEANITMKGLGNDQDQEGTMQIRFARPNRFLFMADQGKDEAITVVSDGEEMTSYMKVTNQYTVEDAPKGLADTENPLLASMLQGPFALIVPGSDSASSLLEEIATAKYEGTEKVSDVECHRLSLTHNEMDMTLWIATGDRPLPQRMVIDMTKAVRAFAGENADVKMEIKIALKDWQVDFEPKPEDFAFDVPQDAEKVESLFSVPQPESSPQELVGLAAPDFSLELLGGGKVNLQDHKDKDIVILDFWATWCGPCVRAMPTITKVAEQFEKQGVVLYAVNLQEEPKEVSEFLKAQELDVTVALDSDGQVAQLYKANAIPQTVLIGKDGRVQAVHVGLLPNLEEKLTTELKALLEGKDLTGDLAEE